ncbi:transposase [Pseudoduganella sp. FT25W]|uniref:Transposase n=1 Tax=Duganella alba TaxID=2666081 RepID=A0A6L5QET5_9BURK|nr:transposase [Duganella alba]MRX08179.1 transposase [Duganella alba]MRX19929.1 transposase [Duganella alba]
MPRHTRVVLKSVPLHVIQRGHDRQRCFFSDEDFLVYRQWLHEEAVMARCAVHAYVLMSNHVHLLVSVDDAERLAAMMKGVAQRYAQYFNRRQQASGSPWDGRYKSCVVQTEGYLLTCQRYIELNPVRAGMVRFPGNYRWSSYRSNAEGRHDELLTPHSVYERLGLNPSDRRQAYMRLFQQPLTPMQIAEIRAAANGNGVLGDKGFGASTPQA